MKINKSFLGNSKGQIQVIFAAAISIIVLFVTISLGLAITANFYAGTGQTPTFSGMWALVVAGVGILTLLIILLRMLG